MTALDRKLYVVGDAVDLVLRTLARTARPSAAGRRGSTRSCASVALRAGAGRSGSRCAAWTCSSPPDGPVVVDVNALPGSKGVPGAARAPRRPPARPRACEEVLTCASSS